MQVCNFYDRFSVSYCRFRINGAPFSHQAPFIRNLHLAWRWSKMLACLISLILLLLQRNFLLAVSHFDSLTEPMKNWFKTHWGVLEEWIVLGDISLATNIYIMTGYTDMWKLIDGLCAIVMDQLKEEPDNHSIYMFCGKRCDRIKVLFREPDGFVLF